MLTLAAHAKINLSLEVLGKRPDGYHELLSVMQTVSLADSLTVADAPHLQFSCSEASLDTDDNLVMRAARALRDRYGVRRGARIELVKRIPAAAGLGGGSSDAAAALVALDRLWNLGASCPELTDIAARIGSDVPFFLTGGIALIEGRGERVTPLAPARPAWFLLARPNVPASTASIFAHVTAGDWTDGRATRGMAARIRAGLAPGDGVNGLERALFASVPEAEHCFNAVAAVAPGRPLVSGSGPTTFARFPSAESANAAAQHLTELGLWAQVVSTCTPDPSETPCRPSDVR